MGVCSGSSAASDTADWASFDATDEGVSRIRTAGTFAAAALAARRGCGVDQRRHEHRRDGRRPARAVQNVGEIVTEEDIVEPAAGQVLDGLELVDAAVARADPGREVRRHPARGILIARRVDAGAAGEEVVAEPADERVVAIPAKQIVGARPAVQDVRAPVAVEEVVECPADEVSRSSLRCLRRARPR